MTFNRTPKVGKAQLKINHRMIGIFISELLDGPCSAPELCEVTGLHLTTVQIWIKAMKAKDCLYVAAWEKDAHHRYSIRVYALGRGNDVRKPAPAPKKSRARKLELVERMAA